MPLMPYWCSDCRSYFSVKLGTVVEASKIPYRKWAIAFYQILTNLKGVSSMKLHRDLGITQKAAWHLGQNPQSDGRRRSHFLRAGGSRRNLSVERRATSMNRFTLDGGQ